jgi:ketosteroid isomerase-like protein
VEFADDHIRNDPALKRTIAMPGIPAAGVVLAAAMMAACNGNDGRGLALDERERVAADAESAIASFFTASNDLDTERLLAHYHQGDELVQVACTSIRRGFNSLAPMLRLWHQDRPDVDLQYDVIRSEALGRDAAVVAAQGRNQDGLALFWTFVLRRDAGGDWRIVQEHQSWPDCRAPSRHP